MRFIKYLLFIFTLFFVSCTTNLKVPDQPKSKFIERSKDATIAFVDDSLIMDETVYPYCSGVWINKTTLLTAFHCTKAGNKIEQAKKVPEQLKKYFPLLIADLDNTLDTEMVYSIGSEMNELDESPSLTHKAKVIAIDINHDLALLKAAENDIPYHTWLQVSNTMPNVGDKVFIIGHPGGLHFTFFDGMVSAIRYGYPSVDDHDIKGPLIQVFSGMFSGNSGGPIISEQGEIIGISSFMTATPNQGFGIASLSIKKFILSMYFKNINN